jgi:hypothetical protein
MVYKTTADFSYEYRNHNEWGLTSSKYYSQSIQNPLDRDVEYKNSWSISEWG